MQHTKAHHLTCCDVEECEGGGECQQTLPDRRVVLSRCSVNLLLTMQLLLRSHLLNVAGVADKDVPMHSGRQR